MQSVEKHLGKKISTLTTLHKYFNIFIFQFIIAYIRAEEGYCTLDYSTTIFSLSSPTGTKTGTDCTEDYLVIPETGKNEGRVCGTKASVKSNYDVIITVPIFKKSENKKLNILENVVMFAFASSKCNCFCNHVKERSSWAEPYWGCLILLQVRKIYLDFSIWGNSAIVQALKTFFLFHHVTILAISQLVWFSWISLLNLSLNLQSNSGSSWHLGQSSHQL